MWLRQSTASQEILLGRFVDSTDGNTEETALTIANTDIKLWVEGATTLASKNSGGATHIANGMYYAVLDATDTATLGKLEVHVHVTGALAVKREYMVLPANVYDALVLGTDALQVDAIQLNGTAQTARDIGASVLISSGTGTGQLSVTSGVIASNVTQFGGSAGTFSGGRPEVNASHWGGTAVASANVRADLRQILGTAPTEGAAGRLAGAFTTFFNVAAPTFTTASVNQTGDSYARIGATGSGLTSLAPAATALSTAQWTNTRAGYLDNLSGGAVALASGVTVSSFAAGLVDGTTGLLMVQANYLGSTVSGGAVELGTNIVNNFALFFDNGGAVLAAVAGNLDATVSSRLATAGYTTPPTVTAIADQVWDEALSGHLTAGTTGAALNGASAPTAATVAAAVWDLSTTGHTTSGTFGAAMNAAGSAGDPWATALPGAYGAGTAGYIVGTNLDAQVSNVDATTGTIMGMIGSPVDLNGSGATIAGNVTDTWNMLTDRIGTPATSLAADIAGVLTVAGSAQTAAEAAYNGTQTINTKIGTPQFGSVSTDLLANYTNINVIVGRLTATRAGYLDNLSGGAVALASGVTVSGWTSAGLQALATTDTGLLSGDSMFGSVVRLIGGAMAQDCGNILSDVAINSPVGLAAQAIWDGTHAATRTLTANPGLDAAGVRSAVGLASANLDTQLSTIAGYIDTEVGAIKTRVELALPSAAPGGSNGLLILGANSGGLTIDNPDGSALTLTASGAFGAGLAVNGSSNGDAVAIIAGSVGSGVKVSGNVGMSVIGTGSYGLLLRSQAPINPVDLALSNSSAPTLRDAVLTAGAITSTVAPNLDAAVSTLATAASVADIKAKTDQLTFTVASHVDATATVDEQAIADAVIAGMGNTADPLLNEVPGTYASGTAGAALGSIASARIEVVSPVASSGDVELVRGDSYTAARGRALSWSSSSWPDVTGAVITMEVDDGSLIVVGSVVSANTVRAEPATSDTASLHEGSYGFRVVATFGTERVTLVTGKCTVVDREDS